MTNIIDLRDRIARRAKAVEKEINPGSADFGLHDAEHAQEREFLRAINELRRRLIVLAKLGAHVDVEKRADNRKKHRSRLRDAGFPLAD